MSVTLIGLGIKKGDLTLSAEGALKAADKIIAHTCATESFENLQGFNAETLDGIFNSSRNFDTLNTNLAKAVLTAGRTQSVCYCVDGAVSEDEACKIILKKTNAVVYEGVSRVSHIKNLAKVGAASVTALSAYTVRYEIDRQKNYDLSCAVAVEEGEFLKKERYDFADLVHMVELLRAPGGCPWDRAQTCESIKGNVVEEAYELADAIERGDDDGILEEVGDILLQAAFHSVLKGEQGAFNAQDATTANVKKLIFRHSHIFGGDKASSECEALGVWDKNKLEEKHMTTFGETVMAVPKNFPACMRAQKVGKRAGKSGMDFLSPVSASEKMWEEVKEMVAAMQAEDKEATFDEAGDVLFAAVNTCRLAGVDCEEALRHATDKFANRFVECEKLIIADGKDITALDELELDYYWVKAKNALK